MGVRLQFPFPKIMNLSEMMGSRYAVAKSYWRLGYLAQSLLVALAVWQAIDPVPSHLVIAGLGSITLPVLIFAFRSSASSVYGEAERLRRHFLLFDGLGYAPSEIDLRNLRRDEPALVANFEPKSVGKYYASDRPLGPHRLVDNIYESAFYTAALGHKAGRFFLAIVVAGSIGSIWMLIAALNGFASMSSAQAAKIFSATMIFFSTGIFVSQYVAFANLASGAQGISDKAAALVKIEELGQVEALLLLNDYDIVLAKAPPIPGVFQWMFRDQIAKAWKTQLSPE